MVEAIMKSMKMEILILSIQSQLFRLMNLKSALYQIAVKLHAEAVNIHESVHLQQIYLRKKEKCIQLFLAVILMEMVDTNRQMVHLFLQREEVAVCAEHIMATNGMATNVSIFEPIMQTSLKKSLLRHAVEPRVAGFYFTNYENRF